MDKQIEEQCDLALIVYYAIRDWQERRYACNEEGLVAVKGRLADFIAAAVRANGYRKQVDGEWIEDVHDWDFPPYDYTDYKCSCCGNREQNRSPFCRECGARMKGE